MSTLADDLKYCAEIVKEKCIGFDDLLKKKVADYSDFVEITNATYEALTWYYYCYSVGDVLSCLEEEISYQTRFIISRYFGSVSNYADFLKENINL